MEHLLLPRNRERLAQLAASNVLLAFDLGGTLAAVKPDSGAIALRPRTRTLLATLAGLYPCAVLSDRPAPEAKRYLGGLGIRAVVGSHCTGGTPIPAKVRARTTEWERLFREALAGVDRVRIENTQLCLSIDYRGSRQRKAVRAALRPLIPQLTGARIIGAGQVVHIIDERAPHKGVSLERVRAELGCDTAVFVGNDEADEGVFALDRPGEILTVRIGSSRSSLARFYLRDQEEIDDLLALLVELRKDREGSGDEDRATPDSPPRPVKLGPPGEAPSLGGVLDFMRVLWAVDHSLQQTSKRMALRIGLTGPQRLVIRIIGRFPGITAGRLAALLHLHPSTLTGILARLKRAGFTERRADPRDRRVAHFGLTAAGRELNVRAEGTVEEAVRRTLDTVRPSDVAGARALLAALQGELDAMRRSSGRARG